jgi:hypothetical protein
LFHTRYIATAGKTEIDPPIPAGRMLGFAFLPYNDKKPASSLPLNFEI